jgi:hypothetical protein
LKIGFGALWKSGLRRRAQRFTPFRHAATVRKRPCRRWRSRYQRRRTYVGARAAALDGGNLRLDSYVKAKAGIAYL